MWLGKRPTASGWPTAFRPSLVASKLGRRISANLRKAFIFITATHIPIAGLALLPVLFALPPLFFPMHVVLLELAIDPVLARVRNRAPTAEIMRQPPRNDISLCGRRELLLSLAQGTMILTTAFSIYYRLFHFGYEVTEARTVAVALL
jgi:Ca2+-transporting ATPase